MSAPGVGPQLREWRRRRRLSQLDLALEAGVSTRHLSFVETGRSRPSADMVLHLAERLDVPLRERNRLLLAAGYAPRYDAHALDDPQLRPVREALDLILEGHEPYPAFVVDRHWNLVASNAGLAPLLEGIADELLRPPANVLRASLHPDGLAPRIINLGEYKAHVLGRLGREVQASGDPVSHALLEELRGYPAPDHHGPAGLADIVIALRLTSPVGDLAFLSTVATFGTALDVTVAELSIETFFPADAFTAQVLRGPRG